MEQDLDASHWIARRDLLRFGAIGAAIGLLSWRAVRPPEPPITETVSVSEALARADAGSITLIDIRRPDEWAATGIATPAHPLDMRRDDFAARLARIAPDADAAGLSEALLTIHEGQSDTAMVRGADIATKSALRLARALLKSEGLL